MGNVKRLTDAPIVPLVVFLFLSACSNPLHYRVASLTESQRENASETLSVDQLKKLDDWISRNTVSGKAIPPALTVEQAIDDQTAWLVEQEIAKAQSDEQRRKAQAERAVKLEALAKVLSVALVSKSNKVQADEQKVATLEFAYDNKGDKDIRGVRGVLKLANTYGDPVIDINWSYDGGAPAKHITVEHDAVVSIDNSVEPQAKLWGTDFDNLKSTFEVNTIIFTDGTSMSALE